MHRRSVSAVVRAIAHCCAAIVLVLLAAGNARADQCSISTTSVSFGSYNVFATAPTDSIGSVTYRCTGNATVSISLSKGKGSTFATRKMTKGTDDLFYNLYRDAARTAIWGDGSGGTQMEFDQSVQKNTDIVVPVYGRIAAGQDVSAGSYTDTVSVLINF